jgi:hypothetical protein
MPPLRPRPSGEAVLFWTLLALHLLLIWVFPFFPSQDGPAHQALSMILREYGRPGAGLLREYYLINREALPNGFVFFLMSKVLAFVSVPVAEKLLLTAYVLLLPLSARYALRAIDPRSVFLSVLAFPFVYNFLFHMGFFNFCFSLPAFLLTLGWWLRRPEGMGPLRIAGLALLILWVYFCHPVTLVVTLTALFTLAGWRVILDLRSGARAFWRSVLHWLPGLVAAGLPALVLMLSFLGRRTGAEIKMMGMLPKVRHLAGLYSLASLSHLTVALGILLALLFFAVALTCLRARLGAPRLTAADGLLLTVGVLTVAYFAAPSDLAGGGFINHRLNLFPFLALTLWFATFEHPPGRRRAIQTAAAAIAVGFLGVLAPVYARINANLKEIVAAGELVEPGHTFLFLSYVPRTEEEDPGVAVFRTRPYVHAGGYVAARRRLADLSLYEANEDYFPIYYRPELNPFRHLATAYLGIETFPPEVDLLGYPRRTGGTVDYVMVWDLRGERLREPKVRAVVEQLAAGYREIPVPGDGKVRLFRANAAAPAGGRPRPGRDQQVR